MTSKISKPLLWLCTAALVLCLCAWRVTQPVILRLGVIAGSAWDVPSPQACDIIDAAIARFEAQNPGILVEYDSGIGPSDYSSWLSDQLLEGTGPDVFLVLPEDFGLLVEIHALKNLDPWMEKSETIRSSDFYESALLAGSSDGHQYALPFACNPQLLFANTTLLSASGLTLPKNGYTLDEFANVCTLMNQDTNGDGVLDQIGIQDYSWQYAANALHYTLLDSSSQKVSLQNPLLYDAISYASRINTLSMPCALNMSFDAGNTAFAIMTYAQYRTYAPYPWRVKRFSSFEWQALEMPRASADSCIETQVLNFAVNNKTLLPQASFDLLTCLCADPEIQSMVSESVQGVSALKSAANLDEDDLLSESLLNSLMSSWTSSSRFPEYSTITDMISKKLDENEESDLDLVLIELEKDINFYLSH